MKEKDTNDKLWRSLEELTAGPQKEVRFNPFNNDFLSRREFLEWTGGMMAVLGAAGCTRQPNEKLIPYTKQPELVIPGKPLFYASAMGLSGSAIGLLVESHMGRPTKVEGNPEHPISLGSTDAISQASVLSLYDPDRSKVLTQNGQVTFWRSFVTQVSEISANHRAKRGEGLRILTENVISPSLASAIGEVLKAMPQAVWHQYEPVHRDNELEGLRLVFGKVVTPWYDFKQAKVLVSFDSDIFSEPTGVRYQRDFTAARSVLGGKKEACRFYAMESTPNLTGTLCDHRLPLRMQEVEQVAVAIGQALGLSIPGKPTLTAEQTKYVQTLVGDVQKNRPDVLFLAGRWQSPVVHAVAHALNAAQTTGKCVRYLAANESRVERNTDSLKSLVNAMSGGQVETLFILGANPAFTAPPDLGFVAAMEKVKARIHCGLYLDETGAKCQWHVPEAHFLEQWSDLRAQDGTVSIVQPTIDPLYGGKTHLEIIAALLGQGEKNAYDLVRDYWKARLTGDFETKWKKAVHDGMVDGEASASESVAVQSAAAWKWSGPEGDLDIQFRPDPAIWDGRFANNGWLQELPKPLTRLTWDNAALMSPATAEKYKVRNEAVVEIQVGEDKVRMPVWVVPGHCNDAITLHLGFGRRMAGRIGNKVGVDVYPLRPSANAWIRTGATMKATGATYPLACTQSHQSMEGRQIVRHASLATFLANPSFAADAHHLPASVKGMDVGTAGGQNAPLAAADYQWGMVVNLSSCTGCNACVVACQAENNIPVVGKTEVSRGREMHWLRIDRYYEGDPANPVAHNQPVACVHCETAPCEVVCPVGATVHDNEGLNNMVYNRCVGTKYCSNNCPYKVRRFNFFEYSDMETPQLKMVRNPDVTVRSRGVMEKCTYCVQRISAARNTAKIEGRKIRDGEVKTACQTACPTQSIVFGDISDPNSLVSRLKEETLNYSLLGELNTKPRTTYLAKVGNPNPELISATVPSNGHGAPHQEHHTESES
jgi:Fe-S-cluster-containing dehydrogenase component